MSMCSANIGIIDGEGLTILDVNAECITSEALASLLRGVAEQLDPPKISDHLLGEPPKQTYPNPWTARYGQSATTTTSHMGDDGEF